MKSAVPCPENYSSQSRRDALTGRWAIFAPGRSERPAELVEAELPPSADGQCPFCSGQEHCTPPPTLLMRDPRDPRERWSVRVVPNLFPAVSQGSCDQEALFTELRHCQSYRASVGPRPLQEQQWPADQWERTSTAPRAAPLPGRPEGANELFEVAEVSGGHEVIVETPHHVESLTDLSREHAAQVFRAYAERMRYWYTVRGIQFVVTFKNVGAAAGASLRHTHSQLIATSLLPPSVAEVGQRVELHYRQAGRCLMCATLDGELADQRRIVLESERLVAYCPFASRVPYLVRIAPRQHADRFELTASGDMGEIAAMVQRVIRSLESLFVGCAYNYTIHTRPQHVAGAATFHWWIEIFPRLVKVAGFEWGSDCYINPVTPETAAHHLRREHRGSSCSPEAPAANFYD